MAVSGAIGYYTRNSVSRIREFRTGASFLVLLVLLGLVVVPLVYMILASFRPAGLLPTDAGEFTLSAYRAVFSSADLWPVIKNTLLYAAGGVVFALPVSFAFAFLTERTDMPLRNHIFVFMFIPMSTPVFATALGWVLLLGPRAGIVNVYFRGLVGSDAAGGPFNIFTLEGMIFVHVLGTIPTMWLFLTAVLRHMDSTLEEAAAASGASRWQTITMVTTPLMRPGVAAVVIYFFLTGLESLELTLALGPTAGVEVLATKIFFTLLPTADLGINYAIPAAFGMLGLVMGIGGIVFYLFLVRRASRYAVVTGKGYRPKVIELGKWKWVGLGSIGLFMFIKVILPFAVLLYASLLRFYVPPTFDYFQDMTWTLQHYRGLFDYRFFGRFFVNTIIVSVVASTATMILVSFIAWLVVRSPGRLSGLINVVAFMPLAIPGTISTVAFFLMFIGTPLYGTLVVLSLAFVARYLAFGTRLMHSSMLQIHQELEEASQTSGGSSVQTLVRIPLPLLTPAFLNGWLWVMVHAAKDFSVALLLASAGSTLVGNVIYESFVGGSFNSAAAMLVALILFNLTLVVGGRRWIVKAMNH